MKKRLLLFIIVLTLLCSHFVFAQVKPVIHQGGFDDFSISSWKTNSDMSKLYVASYEGTVKVIDTKTGNLLDIIQDEVSDYKDWYDNHRIFYMDISPDDKYMVTDILDIWDLSEKLIIKKLEGYETISVRNLAFSPNGNLIAGQGNYNADENTIFIWELNTGKLIYKIVSSCSINNFKFGKDDNTIYFYDCNLTGKKFDLKTKKIIKEIGFNTCSSDGLINISKNEKYIVEYSSLINSVVDITKNKEILEIKRYEGGEIIFSDDEKYIIYSDYLSNGRPAIKIVNLETKKLYKSVELHYSYYNYILSKDSKRIICRGFIFTDLINLETNEQLPMISHDFKINSILFSNEKDKFITTEKTTNEGSEFIIQKYDIKTNKRLWIAANYAQDDYYDLDFSFPTALSKDGKLFATSGYDRGTKTNNLFIYNAENGTLIKKIMGNKNFSRIVFSKDNKYIYASSVDSTIKKWDLTNFVLISGYKFDKQVNLFSIPDINNEIYIFKGDYNDKASLNIFNTETNVTSKIFEFKYNFVNDETPFAFSIDNRYFATNLSYESKVNKILVIDMLLGDTLALLETPEVQRLMFGPESKHIITFTKATRELEIWNLENKQKTSYIKEYLHNKGNLYDDYFVPPFITVLSVSPDGRYFAFGNDEPAVLIYDTQTLDINEENINNKIENCDVFPNPVRDRAEIKLNEFCLSQPVISIYNVFGGRQVIQAEFVSAGDTQKFIINNINLTPGFYIYTITGESNKQRGSFVVIK